MALFWGAIVGQFEVPASFLQEDLVDKACVKKAFEGAINGNLVWAILA